MPALLTDLRRDVALAFRLLARRPLVSITILATLALGLGAPTTVFSVVHAVLLRPLPYADADRLVRFRLEMQSPRGRAAFDELPVAAALEWGASSATLASVALFTETARTLTTADGPLRLAGLAATPNLFDTLGTRPQLGRTFAAADGDVRQVVLSHATWRRDFAASPAVLDTAVVLDGVPHRVVGVMPAEFEFPSPDVAFWVPVVLSADASRGMVLPAIARMRPDATIAAVTEEGRRHLANDGPPRTEITLIVRTLHEQMVGGVSRLLWILMAAVTLVSMIATVNIALVLLTQGAGRAREFSVRLALGASRGRLMRQVAVESLVLATLGGAAAVVLTAGCLRVLRRLPPPDMPRLQHAALDPEVLLFTAGLALLATFLFALLSTGSIVVIDPLRALAAGAGESRLSGAMASKRRLNALAAVEVCLAVVLLVGAGLLLRSLVGLVLIDHGFDGRGALAAQVTLPAARYRTPAARLDFHDRLLGGVRARPGIDAAGLITTMPNRQPTARFAYDTAPLVLMGEPPAGTITEVRMATEGFAEAAGLRLIAGRTFLPGDTDGAEPVMVIDERLARRYFGDRNPVGETLYSPRGDRRIVGVVGPVTPAPSVSMQHDPAAYLPLRQQVSVFQQFATATIVVRGPGAAALAPELRAIVRALDPDLAPFNVRTLDAEIAALTAGPRFTATALGLFAVVALVMAAVGVYGVIAYASTRRTREIGVRVALGATRGHIHRLILRDGVTIIAAGLVPGLLAAAWFARALAGLLHEVGPADPLALTSVIGLVSGVGLIAVYLPARRATRLSALEALREE